MSSVLSGVGSYSKTSLVGTSMDSLKTVLPRAYDYSFLDLGDAPFPLATYYTLLRFYKCTPLVVDSKGFPSEVALLSGSWEIHNYFLASEKSHLIPIAVTSSCYDIGGQF